MPRRSLPFGDETRAAGEEGAVRSRRYSGDVLAAGSRRPRPGQRPVSQVEAEPGIDITTDRAIPIGLVVNELVTNAAKHASQGVQSGNILVRGARGAGDTIELSVRDHSSSDIAHASLPFTLE